MSIKRNKSLSRVCWMFTSLTQLQIKWFKCPCEWLRMSFMSSQFGKSVACSLTRECYWIIFYKHIFYNIPVILLLLMFVACLLIHMPYYWVNNASTWTTHPVFFFKNSTVSDERKFFLMKKTSFSYMFLEESKQQLNFYFFSTS